MIIPPEKEQRRKQVRHYDEPGRAHFLTFSCYQRMSLLAKDRSRIWLTQAIESARIKHSFDLWAWIIMPEHVHLLLWPRLPGYKIDRILADLKRPVGQEAIAWLEANNPAFLERLTVRNRNRNYRHFWQTGPGQDRNVYEPETAYQLDEYIHANPIRRGWVPHAEDWIWSSARDWAGQTDVILKVDRTLPVSSQGRP